MPQAIPFAIAAIKTAAFSVATSVGVSAAGGAAIAGFAVNAVGNLALSAAVTMASSALQPKVTPSGTAIEWTADPDAPLHFAFGRVGVAGQIVHNAVYGPDRMYVGFVGVLSAAGPIDGYVGFKADDATVTFDASGKAVTSEYAGEMWLKRQLGAQPTSTAMTVTGLKNGAAMPSWSASSKLSGKAAYVLVMGENSKQSAYGGKVPTGIHTFRGLKCWDPRLDSTYPGGLGSCRLNDPLTWVYTTNAYLHALKWVLGLWEGPSLKGAPAHDSTTDYQVGGIGALIGGVVVQDYVEGANAFDDNDNWACAAWPSTDDGKAAVLDSFLQAGGGIYAQKAGRIGCVHRIAPRASVATITGADTAGPIELTLATPRKERINTIRPRYWSEAHKWQMAAAGEITSSVWQEEDGQGEPVKRTRGIDYNYVPSAQQATELAALAIANTREGLKGVIPLRPYMMGLEVGDCITLDEPDFVLDGEKVLILDIDDQTDTDVIRVSFVSESDGKYPFAYGETATPPPAPELVPEDRTYVSPPLPGDWTVTPRPPAPGGGQLPGFDLGGVVSNETATAILVEYGPTADGPWKQAYQGPPTVTNIPLDGLQPGATYYVAVQYQRNQNYSDRYVYGPYTAPSLISTDTANVAGVNSDLFVARVVDVETLAAVNANAVSDLEAVYGDTASAAASALAADGSATNAALSVVQAQGAADQAGASADAAIISAEFAETKAGEASNSATAASASQVSASASYNAAVQAAGLAFPPQVTAAFFANTVAGDPTTLPDYPVASTTQTGGWHKQVVPYVQGKVYEVSITVEGVAELTGARVYNAALNSSYASSQEVSASAHVATPVGAITTITGRTAFGVTVPGAYTLPDSANHKWVRFGGIINRTSTGSSDVVPGGQSRLLRVAVTDVTALVQAEQQASAAVTQASNAAASASAAGDHAFAAEGSATTADTRAGEALTYRNQASTSAGEAQSASVTAGTSASNAAGSAATASTQAGNAGTSAASASASAAVAASLGSGNANPNSRFSDWPSSAASPVAWSVWTGANGALAKIAGRNGAPFAARLSNSGAANFGLQATQGRATVTGGERVVITIELTLTSGSLQGAGLYFDARSPSGSMNYIVHNLAVLPDATGTVRGAGVAGQTYRWSILRDARGVGVDRYDMIALNRWSGFSPGGAAVIDWHVCGWRPATPEEIAAGVALPALAASVDQISEAVVSLEDQFELARYQVAAVTSGGAAILSLVSNTYGSIAGISADQIWFGENTYFDNATDTMRTVIGASARVVAYGAAFGTDGQLTEWEGPAATAFSAVSRANAYFYRANVAPYVGGVGFGGGPKVARVNFTGNIGKTTADNVAGTTAAVTVPSTGKFLIDVSAIATASTSGLTFGDMDLSIIKGGVSSGISSTAVFTGTAEGDPVNVTPLLVEVAHNYAGNVSFQIVARGGGGPTSSVLGTVSGTLTATYYPD